MNERDELIRALSADLKTVRPGPPADLLAIGWLLASTLYVVIITHLLGPIRPNAIEQLSSEPRFFTETAWGVAAIALAALAAFRAAVPGTLGPRLKRIATAAMLLWFASYVVGLYSPTLEPSMLGKRPHCLWETLIYALPPLAAGFVLIRRQYPLQPLRTAMVVGLASGMIPALYMQIACMYAPDHVLFFHVLPGMSVALLGAGAAWCLWRRG
jgi:hypothetical protein